MEKSESIKEIATALNKVQKTLQAAKKDSVNPYFKSTYADLLSVWNACRESLTTNGLSISQVADMDSEGRAVLETVLMHTSGEWIKGRLPLSTAKVDPQGQGSAITYARRYSLSAIIGLCTEEDDDAEAATDRKEQKGGKAELPKKHWCAIHQTPFFKKGAMKGYAHPVKDENGKDTGEWCNESETKQAKAKVSAEEQEFENLDKPEISEPLGPQVSPPMLGFIDAQWFRENLTVIQKHKGEAWSSDKLLNYITKSYKVKGETIEQAVANLSKEAADHFVRKMEDALESIFQVEEL